ncbi:Alpha/Beta hydrolase protein [Jimgerdemannia flammicorona]|uniref:Alpha/Beta hydrolase protein n=1 Tax=Jimgerdemannia flammicorona TaxID=994334 RepID=A0A433QZJ9_9FUNG|nr:Alpha/Beta hydrolase protein [Jimgerdemannia flammicorona]
MPTQRVFLPSHDGTPLEVRVSYSDVSNQQDVTSVVIAHPYTPLGGSMQDHLVQFLHEHFSAERGFVTASFNFRGAGRSGGHTTWTAHPEAGDYKTIVDFLIKGGGPVAPADVSSSSMVVLPKPTKMIIAGYSYGSMIAAAIDPSNYPNLTLTYILLSHPQSVYWALASWGSSHFRARANALLAGVPVVGAPPRPPPRVLLVMGTKDNFTGIAAFRRWTAARRRDGLVVREVEGADHFWWGREDEVAEIVDEFLDGEESRVVGE